jgi:hypothetical protein
MFMTFDGFNIGVGAGSTLGFSPSESDGGATTASDNRDTMSNALLAQHVAELFRAGHGDIGALINDPMFMAASEHYLVAQPHG